MSGCADPGGTVGAFLCQAGQVLRAAGIEAPRFEARLLLAHAMCCREEDLLRDARAVVPAAAAASFGAALRRRLRREPVAHIVGQAGFWTLELEVSPTTLIPRADTETIVEAALAALPDRAAVRRVLDLGAGTGALLLALLSELPEAWGIGVDIAPEAAALAARNAAVNGLADRAGFMAADWSEAIGGRFELVVSNPPYIESEAIAGLMPEVALHEPRRALDGGADGLEAYRRIVARLPDLLMPGGIAVLELGTGQREAVGRLAQGAGLQVMDVRRDLGDVERAIVLGPGRP